MSTEQAVETQTRVDSSVAVTEASAPAETLTSIVTSLQGLTDVSEAELMGLDQGTTEEPPAISEPSVPEEKAPEEKAPEVPPETPPEEKAPDEKPPKGFVPLAAVHEVRGENKYLKAQIAQLSAKIDQLSTQPVVPVAPQAPSKFADFKELSDDEFTALAAEDAPEALAYMKTLADYRDYTRAQQQEQVQAEALAARAEQIFADTHAAMESAVPGLLVADSPVASEFKNFAVDLGFTDDMFYLTDPSTKIILPGDSEPLLLGEQAAQVIRMLANAQKRIKATQPTLSREAIEAELRTKIEAEVMAKLKTSSTPAFRSLSDVPDSEGTRPEFASATLTEAQYEKLTDKEKELYLAGM